MSTLHANSPRDAISRVESYGDDGEFKPTSLMPFVVRLSVPSNWWFKSVACVMGHEKSPVFSEIVGLEGESVVMEEIFRFQYEEVGYGEAVRGRFLTEGLMQRSELVKKAHFYGLYDELMKAFQGA